MQEVAGADRPDADLAVLQPRHANRLVAGEAAAMEVELVGRTVVLELEAEGIPAGDLAKLANGAGLNADPATDLLAAVEDIAKQSESPRILICGSLYLAGQVLRDHS